MTARSTRRRLLAAGAVFASGALLLVGCGDQTDDAGDDGKETESSSSSSSGTAKSPADLLPQKIKNAGVIEVGSDIAYPPVEFKQGGKVVGIDPDLAAALGEELGVKFEFTNGKFDSLLTGLRAERFDIVMSAMSDTKNRQDGTDPETGKKVSDGVDFVDYFTAGVSLYTVKGNPDGIKGWDDLCGKKIVVQRQTVSHDQAKAKSKECEDKGKKKISIEAHSTDIDAQTRLRGGGADAGSSDYPVAAYAVQKSGGGNHFELIGEQELAGPYGIAVSKDDTELRDALKAALEELIKNGEYQKIIDKWEVPEGAVSEVKINGGS
ncbi:atrA protein [Wenjunlia vitaminophila]|uniref:AtrA protein n=1 Tax=Wenjunlia vitaminophila TaxID=76728 RepID=A0A0T6LM58_WENVI|nr:ABC transporter substrate-binding protein [Wenjunlia vitaminophila]KRV47158.1 atrA protein [Wenjunlia vitaminophila]